MSRNRSGMVLVQEWRCRECDCLNNPYAERCWQCDADTDGEPAPKQLEDGEIQ